MAIRIEVNVLTGEVKEIEYTPEEIIVEVPQEEQPAPAESTQG